MFSHDLILLPRNRNVTFSTLLSQTELNVVSIASHDNCCLSHMDRDIIGTIKKTKKKTGRHDP